MTIMMMNLVKGFNCSSSKIATLKYFLIISFKISFQNTSRFRQSMLTLRYIIVKLPAQTEVQTLYKVRAASVASKDSSPFCSYSSSHYPDSTGEIAASAWVFRALAQTKAAAQWRPCSCTATCLFYSCQLHSY